MRRQLLLLLLLSGLCPGGFLGQEDIPEPARAGQEELQEIYQRQEIQTVPDYPGVSAYLRDLYYAVLNWIAERFGSGLMAFFSSLGVVGAQVLFLLAFGLLAALLAWVSYDQYLRRRRRAWREPSVTAKRTDTEAATKEAAENGWADELRQRLAAGEVGPACEALWWWLARSLLPGQVERSWTSRELLSRANRADLRRPVTRLDRMIYGSRPPTLDEVRHLWRDLEQGMSSGSSVPPGSSTHGAVEG